MSLFNTGKGVNLTDGISYTICVIRFKKKKKVISPGRRVQYRRVPLRGCTRIGHERDLR